jgi:hypothetical protein
VNVGLKPRPGSSNREVLAGLIERVTFHALSFLVRWPALDRAASLVLQRWDELDGDHYEILTHATDALAGSTHSRRRWCCVR